MSSERQCTTKRPVAMNARFVGVSVSIMRLFPCFLIIYALNLTIYHSTKPNSRLFSWYPPAKAPQAKVFEASSPVKYSRHSNAILSFLDLGSTSSIPKTTSLSRTLRTFSLYPHGSQMSLIQALRGLVSKSRAWFPPGVGPVSQSQ